MQQMDVGYRSRLQDVLGTKDWIKGLRGRDLFPQDVVLEPVDAELATERERYWINHCIASGHPRANIRLRDDVARRRNVGLSASL